jgi:predicted Zn-ribbon and HTH transcriptional regulator
MIESVKCGTGDNEVVPRHARPAGGGLPPGQFASESLVNLEWNGWSVWSGISGQFAPEYSHTARSAKEISFAIRRPEKEIKNHLEHIRKSLRTEGRRMTQIPAECRGCGFVFRKRDRLKAPGRCPVCRGESISDPFFRIE